MARPLFLSYSWSDENEVDLLDSALRLRGVPVWRDRREMTFGTYNEDRVREGIDQICSGFALYYSDAVLESDFILGIELPAMDARRRRGTPPAFFAGAVLRRQLRFEDAAEELRRSAGGIGLGEALGGHVSDEDFDSDLRQAANAILAAYLRGDLQGEEVGLRVETRGEVPNDDPSLLHLCWCPPLDNDPHLHPEQVWERHLLPALADLHTALETASAPPRLRIGGKLHLSAAIALGWEFRQPSGWSLELDHEFVPCETALVPPDAHGWRLTVEPGPVTGDSRLLVCVHATQDVANAMRAHCRDLPPARAVLHVYPPSGSPDRTSVDPAQANELAAAIAAKINACRTELQTSETHLYLACPWPLAALLGWHLSSSGRLVMHEPDVEKGSYRASCELA
jgi:SMODS-associated and fused to various effectors sensor domain